MTTTQEAEALLDELNLVLSDPDNQLSPGSERALKWAVKTIEVQASQQSVAVPPGYRLVPVEPTLEMLSAISGEWHSSRHANARKHYAAMLAAAPPAPQEAREPLTDGRIEKLKSALTLLMEWQVKNVRVWHNRAYDNAAEVLASINNEAAHGIAATAKGERG